MQIAAMEPNGAMRRFVMHAPLPFHGEQVKSAAGGRVAAALSLPAAISALVIKLFFTLP